MLNMGTTYVSILALLAIFIAGEGSLAMFVKYTTGYEYLYKFHTNADMNKVGDFLYSGKIGFVPLDDNENGQELLLRVYLFQMQRREGSVIKEQGLDFSKWFSFVISQQGEILHVYFPNTEDEEVLALKKAFAALISGKFHHIDHQSVEKSKGGKYGYKTQEIGHEGPHNATYSVEPNETGLKFTKVRNGHVMPTAESDYTKTVHYHEGLGIIHKVQVKENVEVAKTPTDFNPFEGQRPVKAVNTFTMMKWPKFSAVSDGEASFLARNKLSQKVVKPKKQFVKDSIRVTDLKKGFKRAQNASQIFEFIQGNLTCMRNSDAFTKGIDGISCFTNLIKMVEILPDEEVTKLSETIFHPKRVLIGKFAANAKLMVDVFMAVDTDLTLGILLKMVFKSTIPNKELIHRLLEAFAGRDKPPLQDFITALEHFVFNSEKYPEGLRDGSTVHRATLALGSICHSLVKNDRYDHAKRIVGRIEGNLGMHDPWTDRQKRSTMDEYEIEQHDLNQVIFLDALGNAALETSWHHIISYINSSTSIWVRKTGVHSLRKFKHEEAAMRMLHSAINDESDVVRYEAGLTFQAHPKAQHHLLKDGPGPRNASRKVYEEDHEGNMVEADQRLSRNKRGLPFSFNIEFHLHSPSFEWRKILGSTSVGASFGLIIKNNLDLKLQPLEGSLKVEIHNEAYATIHLGIMGLNIDYMKIRICFIGGAAYNLNILQDFNFELVIKMVERFEKAFNTVVDSIDKGLDKLGKLFSGEEDPGVTINDFVDKLGAMPSHVLGLKTFASATMKIIGELNMKQLPSFIKPIANVALRFANLLSDIQSDVMNYYNTLLETIQIALPRAIEMIFKAVIDIINVFEDFFNAPGHAIITIFKSVMQAQLGVISLLQSMTDLKGASFFLAGNRPYWWNLKPLLTEIGTTLTKELKTVNTKATAWMKYNPKVDDKSKDPVYALTKGKQTTRDMKQSVITNFVENALGGAQDIFDTIMPLFQPFLDAMNKAMVLMQEIKVGYERLDNGYSIAKKVIDRVFGPKFHKKFPKKQRVAGSGCTGTGFYPSTYGKANVVEHRMMGIDLTVTKAQVIVAPRGGSIMLTPYKNEVVIKAGGITGLNYFISYIVPNDTIKMSNDPSYVKTMVTPGQVIGKALAAAPHCSNHIHVVVKKLAFIVDPTKFIPKPLIQLPRWVAKCDDYKIVYKADVKAAGSVIGKLGQMKKNGLPKRTNAPKKATTDKSTTKEPTSTKQKAEKTNPNSVSNKLKQAEEDEAASAVSECALPSRRNDRSIRMRRGCGDPDPCSSAPAPSPSRRHDRSIRTRRGCRRYDRATTTTTQCEQNQTDPNSVSNKLKDAEKTEAAAAAPAPAAAAPAPAAPASSSGPAPAQCEQNQKMVNGKCTASSAAGFPAFSPGRMMKWGIFKIKNLKLGKIVAFLEKLNLPETKEQIRLLFVAIKDLVNNRRCSNPEQMTDEELRLELVDRGLASAGARAVLISTYKGAAAKCPLIQLTLPKEIYCVLDPMCLGIQCCVEIGVQMFKFSVKAWARINPCTFTLSFGIKASVFGWQKSFDLKDIFFGGDYSLPTNIKFDVLPDVEIRAMIKIQKTDTKSELSFGFALCYIGDPDNCWSPQMLMDNAVISLPVCNADGSMTWPYVSWSDFLARDVIRNRLLAAGKKEAKAETEQKAKDLVKEMGLPEEMLDPTPPCPRPDTLTNSKMDKSLEERGLSTSGTRSDKDTRLMLADFSCSANGQDFSLPTLTTSEMDSMYYSISDDCRRFDACFDIDLTEVSVTKSFRAYIDLDTCNYEFRVGFENYEETFVTFVYTWGEPRNFTIGDLTQVFYTISKNENTQEFIVDMSVEVCKMVVDPNPPSTTPHPDGIDLGPVMLKQCFADLTILSSLAIPMQSCGSDFSLPGGNTIKGFLTEMGGQLSDGAFDVILKTNQLEDILPEGSCPLPVPPSTCGWGLDQSHMSAGDLGYMNCSLTDSCFGVICCIDLPFNIPDALDMINRTVEVSFDIEPCDFTIHIAVGSSWTYSSDLISYDWGKPMVLEIGTKAGVNADSPVQVTYTLEKDDSDFYITFDVLFCVDVDDQRVCMPSDVPVTLIKRMKVPRCNPATLDAANADTTIRSWMTKMGISDGTVLSEAGIDQFLQETSIIKNVQGGQCDMLRAPYDSAVDGWKNDCPLGFYDLPVLGDGIRCHIQDLCSGISCCYNVNFHGIYQRALNMEFIVDTCNYVIRGSIERFNFTYSIFTYDWGVEDSFDLMDLFKVTYTLNKIPNKKKYSVTMKLSICLDPGQPCQAEHQLYKNTEVPQTACDMSQTIVLPDGQTLKEFYDAEAPLSVEALEASLRSLGLGHIIMATSNICPETNLPIEEVCPDNSITVPTGQPSGTTCQVNYPCLGIECCSSIDLGIINAVFKTWLIIDPCEYRLSLGFEHFNFNTTLFTFVRGVEKRIDIGTGSPSPIALVYTIDKDANNFEFNLHLDLNIPGFTTTQLPLLVDYVFPIPYCNINDTFEWPSGTLAKTASEVVGTPTEYANEAVLRSTNLYWIVEGDMCQFNSSLTQAELGSRCRHLKMPKLPDFVQCRYDDLCMGFECCLNVDYRIMKKPMKVWSIVDSCSDKVSAGLETYQYNVTLDASFWDRENLLEISDFVRAFFSVSKDDSTAMLAYTFVLSIYLDDDNTYPMLDKLQMPLPECNDGYSLGTGLNSFLTSFPSNTMVGATDDIFRRLDLPLSFFSTSSCPIADDYAPVSHANCPNFVYPTMPEGFRCKLNSDCLSMDCCATMHFFGQMEYTVKATFEIMPCSYEVQVGVETDLVVRNIFEDFGSVWSKSYGNAIQVMYNIKKGVPGQFVMDFGLRYCTDGMCSDILYFMHDTIMSVPLCENNVMTWPTIDVKAAMIGYAGDAAQKILALQDNLLRDNLTCILSVSKPSCPYFKLPSLPDNYRCAYNNECTGFDCCIDVDMKVSSRTFQFRILLDPCRLSFHVGFEKWEFNNTLKGYSWGDQVTSDISSTIRLAYTIDRPSNGKNFIVSSMLTFDADAFGLTLPNVAFTDLSMPIPQCNYEDNTITWPQDIVRNSASGLILSQLGVSPQLLNTGACKTQSEASGDLDARCPHFSMGSLPTGVSCTFSDMCTGMICCAEIDFGVLRRKFEVWAQIDPCTFMLSVGFEKWNLNVTLIGFTQAEEKTEPIGKGLNLKYKIGQSVDRRDFYISLSLFICSQEDGTCQPDLVIFTDASVPVPFCNPDKTFSWPSFDNVDANGQMVQPASAIVLNRLGAEQKALLDIECQMPTVVNPSKCKAYKMPKLPENVKCAFSDKCTGVECCAAMDMKVTSRNFKVWFDIDPCDYTLSVGFERMFRNLSLIGFKFGKEKGIKVGKNVKLYYMLDRTVAKGHYIISMRYVTCLDSICEDAVLFTNLKLVTPFCADDGSLSWPISAYGSLLPNIIGTEVSLLKNPSCNLNAIQAAAGTNCADYQLSTFGRQYCTMDKSCLNIACCYPSDLVVETKNLYFNFKIKHCGEKLEYSFEKKKFSRSLIGFEYGVTQVEQIGSAITLSYIIRDNGGRYQVRAEVKTCFSDNWNAVESCKTDVLLMMTYYKKPVCSKRKRRSLFTDHRVRRSALIQRRLKPSQSGTTVQEQIIAGAVKSGKTDAEIAQMFANDVGKKGKVTLNGKVVKKKKPAYPPNLTVFQRAQKTLTGKGPASHQKPKMLTSKSIPTTIPAAAKVIEMLGEGSDVAAPSDKTFLFGKGLTANGIHLLGLQLANMSIGDLEVFLIMARLDPIQMFNLAVTMKDLFVTLYNEMIDVFSNPDKLAEFANDELILKGSFPMPKTSVTFFKRTMYFMVGMLIPMTFSFGADGYYGAECTLGVKVLQMSAFAEVTPYTGILVWGELGLGALLYGKLRLEGYICELRFPTYAEIWFMKFPFDVALKMDLVIIPLKLKLIALVTLEVDLALVTIKKVLFSMNLWEFTSPSIRTNIFTVSTKDEDTSPPEFAGKDSTSGKRGAATRSCEVAQLAGRDFTEPGFEISVRANDDRSQVEMMLDIGSVQGGSDLVPGLELAGENNNFIQDIPLNGLPVFFKITATNSAGVAVYVTCDLPTYDVTLPIGRMNTDFITTSNPRVLRASLVAMEDSPITEQNVGIGFGKEIYGDAVVEWNHFDLKPNTKQLGSSGDTLAHFTSYKLGRVNSKTTTFSGMVGTPQECASKCMAMPSIRCMSFNFDFSSAGTCECLPGIEGPDNIMSEDGVYYHYERLGIGHAVEFNYRDLWLEHNNLYYINTQIINYIDYESIISTEGILFDGTPPYPGKCPNAVEFNEWVDCHIYIPYDREDWRHICTDVSKELHNHRITHDGDDGMTVFNGIKPLEDLKYTRANRFISVNWDGIHDHETGIHGYTWTIGLELCQDLVHPHHDPQSHLYDESEWTHSGTIYPVPPPYEILPDNKYYTTIRALNKVNYGGPMSLTICHTTPLGIDNTPPIFYEMYNFAYNETALVASVDYNATDPQSDIMFIDACMGQTSRDCYLVPWINLKGNTGSCIFQCEIPSGVLAWPKVKVGNHVLLTTIGVGAPIIIDLTPPLPGEVYDGPHFGFDLNYTKESTEICASWYDFSDPESGISKYELGLGTAPDLDDVIERIEYHGRTTQACIDTLAVANLTLSHNTRYYFTVWAWNNANKLLFVNVSSDGVLVDLTPPVEGQIIDGTKSGFQDLVFSSKPATVEAQWRNYQDPESHLIDYEVQVEIAPDMTSDFAVGHSYESVYPETTITWHHFHLHHRDIVKTGLRTTNGAINSITSETNSFVVDLTPPVMDYLNDGPTPGVDIDYTSSDDIAANWDFHDDESDVEGYGLALYEMYQGTKRPKNPATRGQYIAKTKTQKTIDEANQGLINGAAYFSENMATNGADLSAVYRTSSFKVDKTAPIMQFVHVGVYSGFTEELVDEHCWQQRLDSMIGSWKAIDGQSGIKKYSVAIGTSEGATDVSGFRDMSNLDQGIIRGLTLALTNQAIMSPLYFMTVKAMNGAGLWSAPLSSEHGLIVVDEDKVGLAVDGPTGTENNPYTVMGVDMSYTKETTTVTVQFEGFESQLHGLKRFEWAIGKTPHHEDVQPFIELGIILRNDHTTQSTIEGGGLVGSGKATASLDLETDVWYYASVRGITYGDNVLECVTDGFVIDRTAPSITLETVGLQDGTAGLGEDGVVYEMSVDSYTAEWHYTEHTSFITEAWYGVGTHPDGDDISGRQDITNIKPAYFDNIPNALVKPVADGRPNVLTVHAVNTVGLASKVISATITIDLTPPVGGRVVCPRQISAVTELQCEWHGFFEAQSKIVMYRFAIGTQEGYEDIFAYADVDPSMDRYMASNFLQPLEHKNTYYVSVEAENSVGLKVWGYSESITIDNTPPAYGIIVETAGISQLDWKRGMFGDEQSFTCDSEETCLEIDAICQESLLQVAAAWTPFSDEETGIVRYQLAVGTSPGGANIKQFFDIPVELTHYLIEDLDLNGVRQVFVTIKGYNGAGLFSITISNGIYLTYLGQGLQPLSPVEVWDNNDPFGDKDFQADSEQLSARWDFNGDPCPIIKYFWAIYRIDNLELQPWTDTQVNTFANNDEMNMASGQTFYVRVKGINAIGMEFHIRSDGITVQKDPLIPGRVNDGNVVGYDLLYLPDVTSMKANWDGFGVATEETARASVLSGNAGVIEEEEEVDNRNQEVDYYEIAIGSDRRYPKTRDNILPFTNVGKNKTVQIFDLELIPRTALYYTTIRAHSASLAEVEVTSNGFYVGFDNGVKMGEIDLQDFWQYDDYLKMQWSGFKSEVEILFYNVGISNTSDPSGFSCKHLTSKVITSAELASLFPILYLSNVGSNQLAEIFNMTMEHTQTYYAYVIATDGTGECNMTMKDFYIDVTDPVEGAIKTGPYWDMDVTYAPSNIELEFFWEGYSDAESDLKEFQVTLLYAESCSKADEVNMTTLVDWITIPANYTTYKFVELDLQPSIPYYIHLRTINNADLMILTISNPILLDNSAPIPGDVIIGTNFLTPLVWNGAEDTVYVNFLHLQTPDGPSCPDSPAPMFTDDWYNIITSGILNPGGVPWLIEYRKTEVKREDNDTIVISMVQDTKKPLMYSGAYSRHADMVNGGHYQIDIQAAFGDQSATSIVFWDGPEGVIGDVNYREPRDWSQGNCECCAEDPIPPECPCDCAAYDADQRFKLEMQLYNITTVEPTTELYTGTEEFTTPGGTSAPVPWVIVADTKPGQVVYSAFEQQPAYTSCGMSLHSTGGKHYAVGWCRSGNDTRDLQSTKNELPFDPREWNTYKVEFNIDNNDPSMPHWCFNVFTETFNIIEICGIDAMSTDTKMIVHVWNANNHIPVMQDAFTSFSTEAKFKGVRFPPSSALECRYGLPFRGGTNAIIRYEAAVGTAIGLEDIMPYSTAVVPCVPCVNPCDRFFCNSTCENTVTENILFSISNISMPMIRNETNTTGFITAYDKSLPYFVALKAVLGSGSSIFASSMNFYIDLTPPTIEINMMYIDMSLDPLVPVQYQASNDTIKALWKCDDSESMIKEYQWAIGTAPNTTNIQNFTSVSWNPSGMNDQLAGYIEHNTTYYVTVKCTNHANLQTLMIDRIGITAILELPIVDDVNNTIPGAEAFEHEVFPATAQQAKDPTKAGVSWTKAADLTINRYEYCLGSSNETLDDVFPCTWVGYNASGMVEIKDGALYLDNMAIANLSSYVVPNSDTNLTAVTKDKASSGFAMEPGRTLFTTMRICNEAEVCIFKFVSTVTITDAGSQLETSTNGEAITASLSEAKKRKKRSASRDVSITTPSGMSSGQSIILGALSVEDLSGSFSSGGSVDFAPFVVNPNTTQDMTTRLLQKRISEMATDSFYLAPLAHEALPDAMEVTVSYFANQVSTLVMPMLIHWDPDSSAWMISNETCSSNVANRHVLDVANMEFTTKICRTRTSNSTVSSSSRRRRRRRRRRSLSSEEYFVEETQFVVATVLRDVPNNYPNVTAELSIYMQEDAGTLSYQLTAADEDGDSVLWALDTGQSWTPTGTPTLSGAGIFTYRPCLDCYGADVVPIMVYEDRSDGVTALYTYANVTIQVTSTKDNPEMFFSQFGVDLFPYKTNYKEITITVEQNTPENTVYTPWIGLVGAHDRDDGDTLTVNILSPSNGNVMLTGEVTTNPVLPSTCTSDMVAEANPCGINLDHAISAYAWKLSTIVYTPDSQYYGMDEFKVIIEDSGGKYSDILTVTVAVLENPCTSNSTCIGQTDDVDCTATKRATIGFLNEYSCDCLPGWTGDTCDTDFNECSSAPCLYPYACFDKFNGYECGCPPDWLICDSGLTPITVGLIAIIFILICVVIGFVVWYKRSKLGGSLGDLMPLGKANKAYYNIDAKQKRTLNMAKKGDGFYRDPIFTTQAAQKLKAREAGILDDDYDDSPSSTPDYERRPESVDFSVKTPQPPPVVRTTTTQIDTEMEVAPSPIYFNKKKLANDKKDKPESKKLYNLWKEMKASKMPSTPEPDSPTPAKEPKRTTRIQRISIPKLRKASQPKAQPKAQPKSAKSTTSKVSGRTSAASTTTVESMPGSLDL